MQAQWAREQRGAAKLVAVLLLSVLCVWPAALFAEQPRARQAEDRKSLVNNVWMDTPLSQVLRDISAQAGVTITVDPVLADLPISFDAHDLPVSDCLAKITMGKGLAVRQIDPGLYLVGSDRPGAVSFTQVSESRRIPLKYVTAHHVRESLALDLRPYVSSGDRTTEVQLFAPPEKLARIAEVVQQLDVPIPQVVLEALVVELSRDSSNAAGIDWSAAGPNALFSLTNATDAFSSQVQYTTVSESNMTTVTAALNLLVSAGKAKIRSRPRIATLNGMPATIDASLEQVFPIITYVGTPYLQTSLQTVKSGVVLQMAPQVGANDDITVHVQTEVSDVVGQKSQIGSAQDTLPVIRRRKADAFIRVKSGEAIVIGGLIESQMRDEVRRVPILGYIPLLGALFTSKQSSAVENEIIIFIKPHIMAPGESALQDGHETIDVQKERQTLQNPSLRPPEKGALDRPTTGESW